ncbi:alpha/beta-hydrolase [Melanomma pulvis-pyrius CBS 109.77]|uniref:Alpha/beta-hydrolase n=1 Tax=Melanomma pulvis-pyrius CBS 109.77 TaxID=1314802 RepID=A0A6A6WPC0_9PLEO|nr:alpha/beta-hydrolase [Melanomma pulvis-pyrius CBS 109.77]
MSLISPLSRIPEPALGLVKKRYTVMSGTKTDPVEIYLWRIATCSAGESPTPQLGAIWVPGGAMLQLDIDMETADTAFISDYLTAKLGTEPLDALGRGYVLLYVAYRAGRPFPEPPRDVLAAYEFAYAHAAELGILPHCIPILGCSAGANLAWAATHMVLDRVGEDSEGGLRAPPGLMCIYPMLNPHTEWKNTVGGIVPATAARLRRGWESYLGQLETLSEEDQKYQKYAKLLELSPKDLGKLGPMYMDVGTSDYFEEEIGGAVDTLKNAGVAVTFVVLDGVGHGFEKALFTDDPESPVWRKACNERRSFLRSLLSSEGAAT